MTNRVVLSVAVLLLLPTGVLAQTGSIAGSVTDETGGVLPGVTVAADSPAQIGGARVTVTDGSGLFVIEALVPGVYTVTFTLPGFSTFVREGIELTSGFTANVDAQMNVGAIEETVTVSGASPLIDVQNVVTQQNLSREQIDSLPTGKTYWGFAALTPAIVPAITGGGQDVGGSVGDAWGGLTMHGSRVSDGAYELDGMTFNNGVANGGGSSKEFFINQASVLEVVIATSTMSAETALGGVGVNAIPKEGGNAFSYYVNVSGTNEHLRMENFSDELRDRGLPATGGIKTVYDYGAGVGGPLVRDKLWFYTAHRWWGSDKFQPASFSNLTPNTPFYTPDFDDPTAWVNRQASNNLRLTWQVTERNKLSMSHDNQRNCNCVFWSNFGFSDRAASVDYEFKPVHLNQVKWTFPATNRLLFEAGASYLRNLVSARPQPEVLPTDVATLTFTPTFQNHNAHGVCQSTACLYGPDQNFPNFVSKASMSYVTGSHNFKVGFSTLHLEENYGGAGVSVLNNLRYDFGAPGFSFQVNQYGTPRRALQTSNELGLYAQDQWTIDRLTMNLGVRYDYINGYVPAQTHPASRFVDTFSIERISNVPNWHDISPRLGVSYDLFGSGRTAVKAALGRYTQAIGPSVAVENNPMEQIIVGSSRAWNDQPFPFFGLPAGNGDLNPDCNFDDFSANGECGPIRDPEFGTPAITRRWDPDLLEGWGKRPYHWQTTVSVQHELVTGWSIEAGYHRTSFGNHTVEDNLNIGPSDFDEYSIIAPTDPRLGSVSGQPITGLYTITAEGQAAGTNTLVTLAENFGTAEQVFDGFDFNFAGRLDNGVTLGGGASTGRTRVDQCFVVDSPEQLRNCALAQPWGAGTQLKLNGSVPLPYDTQVSFVFQNLAGLPWQSEYNVGVDQAERASIEEQIGRPMVVGSEEIQLLRAGETDTAASSFQAHSFASEIFEPRLTQLDLRFTKIFQVGNARIRGWFDIFNVFNASDATALASNYGTTIYPLVTSVMNGRMFAFGGQFDF